MYVLPLPANIEELKEIITTALQTVAQDMLHRAWEELEYRIDVCQVSGGAHTEHLLRKNKHIFMCVCSVVFFQSRVFVIYI